MSDEAIGNVEDHPRFDEFNTIVIGVPPLIGSAIGLIVAAYFAFQVSRQTIVPSDEKLAPTVEAIQKNVALGARAFLHKEYTYLAVVASLLFIMICIVIGWGTGLCYLAGCFVSALCGYLGMMMATYGNARTSIAAEKGLDEALRVSFMSGSVMGLCVVSLGLGAISCLLMAFDDNAVAGNIALSGFGMGASTVSIFARVAGGIFTKAADVGADLVGKVEEDFPEDDVRNPATIADNVGDNVGDVAGMGADLFSSFVGSIIACAILGFDQHGLVGIALPYWISTSGIICCIIGMFLVRTKEGASMKDLLNVLRRAIFITAFIECGCMAVVIHVLRMDWRLFFCLIIGLAAGIMISFWSEYFTSGAYPPTMGIARSGNLGPANVIIEGISVGSFSTIGPVLFIAATIIAVRALSQSAFGIALASVGMLSTLGITLATDAYGPVADNAGGIAEMAKLPSHVRHNTDTLDALGNTTAAVGKGFAVGSAVLTAVSLLSTYTRRVGILNTLNPITDYYFIPGVLVGAMLPYAFAALTMGAVAQAAGAVVVEVRRQLREIKGLREGLPGVEADCVKCVSLVTEAALYKMIPPALLVILSPMVIGIGLGPEMLAGLLLGAIVSGFVLGGLMNSAGGAWDNAKKLNEQDGQKGSFKHKSTVVGDTVGDPFKDTSGPAINIQIKLMSYISVVLVPVFKKQTDFWWVAIIIIVVMAALYPVYVHFCPASLNSDDVEKAFMAGNAKAAGTYAKVETKDDMMMENNETRSMEMVKTNGGEQDM